MTEQEHMKCIAFLCKEIENHLNAIQSNVDALDRIYGIQIAETGVQYGCQVHVYAGLELIEKALGVKAKEKTDTIMSKRRTFKFRGVERHKNAHGLCMRGTFRFP